ncbi:hypothetical protein PYCC9005_005501 [Savitreella phatthalungensis]
MISSVLASLTRCSVTRAGRTVVRDLDLRIDLRERWVVTGVLGSGKTTLLDVLRGSVPADDPLSVKYPFLGAQEWPGQVIKKLSAGGDGNGAAAAAAAYFSERYHSRRDEDDQTLRVWLSLAATESNESDVEKVANALGLGRLLDASLMNLSNGQTRRAQVARAVVARPRVLLLDEPFVGLDPAARKTLARVLGDLDTSLVLATRPLDDVPDWATHMLVLGGENGCAIASGEVASVLPVLDRLRKSSHAEASRALSNLKRAQSGRPLVQMRDLSIAYWGKSVLSSVNWQIDAGSRWHLQGPNGSGKTTLLAVALGDHPKLYNNDVKFDGRSPGPGFSVHDWQRRVGHTSPEIHRHFPRWQSVRQALLSAWSESFHPLPRSEVTDDRVRQVDELVAWFAGGISHRDPCAWLDQTLGDLPPGEQRLVLLLRALVKKPDLLVLDEPFAGMDAPQIDLAHKFIDHELHPDTALVFVTHHIDEVPKSVDRVLRLDGGCVVDG